LGFLVWNGCFFLLKIGGGNGFRIAFTVISMAAQDPHGIVLPIESAPVDKPGVRVRMR
jgi:hypothetical protein